MAIPDESRVIIQPLSANWFSGKVAAVDMLRLDLIHPVISGNKWYKLRYNIEFALQHNYKHILTFGGGYSNHLAATACAARVFGLKCTALVRGNYPVLTPTLSQCREYGMELIFIDHKTFHRYTVDHHTDELRLCYPDALIIPMGGDNEAGRRGAGLIGKYCNGYTHVAVSIGTGATFAGIRMNTAPEQNLLGFALMKNGKYMEHELEKIIGHHNNWELFDNWHFGGFGKVNDELLQSMNDFYLENHIPLDIVYTGKMMAGLKAMILSDFFSPTASILCIHTGGLQGNVSVAGKLYC